MFPEEKKPSISTLQEISKEIIQCARSFIQETDFKTQHQIAFETIKKIERTDNWVCDCGSHYPTRKMVGDFHAALRDFLKEITQDRIKIENDWTKQNDPQQRDQTKRIENIINHLKGLESNCVFSWTDSAMEAIKTIAFIRKGNILQQLAKITGTKEIIPKKKEEEEFKELSNWQCKVLKYLN